MRKPDLIPLVASWIIWEMFFDEPEPTDAQRKDDQRQSPPGSEDPSA